MKFKCNFCVTEITPPRMFVEEQRFKCTNCGAKYKQQLVRQVIADTEKV